MSWVSFDGIISVGKSTLLDQIISLLGKDVVKCPEPVDKWIASGMLKLSYEDPEIYSFPAQCMFFDTRVDQINEVWEDGKLMISERSPFSDSLFWETKRRNGDVNDTLHAIYMNIWKKWQRLTPKECPDLFIYLDASLETCMNRLKQRGREAENSVTMEYQRILKEVHDKTFGGTHVEMPNGKRVPVIRVDTEIDYSKNPEELEKVVQRIMKVLELTQYMEIVERSKNDDYQPEEIDLLVYDEDNDKIIRVDQNMKWLNQYH
jgi:deoxyadenosine/deoxycytidine kinase